MPSKHRGEELRAIIRKVRDGTFEYESREPPKTNWTQYDKAQIYEMVYYLNNIRDLVDEADRRIKERTPPKKIGAGRPPIDPADIAKALLLQTYTNSPNRLTEGLLLLFHEKLGISRHFSYNMSFGYFETSAKLNPTTSPIYTLNCTARPSISWISIPFSIHRPLLSFLINSGSFGFISSSITFFSLSTKAFPSS